MDMEALMAQAQDLQTKINDAQNSLGNMHVKGIAENGMVVVDMTGKYEILSVAVSDAALAKGATAVSEMVTMACRDAKAKADVLIDKTMSEITGSLQQ